MAGFLFVLQPPVTPVAPARPVDPVHPVYPCPPGINLLSRSLLVIPTRISFPL